MNTVIVPADEAPTPCASCDRLAAIDGFCLPCAAQNELSLDEGERRSVRDLLAELLTDEEGLPWYDHADRIWMTLYRAGFDIMRQPIAGESP